MKRTAILILSSIMCILFSVISFAEGVYVVDDADDDFVPPTTTTVPAETTGSSFGNIISDSDIDSYLGGLGEAIGGGIDSILSGIGNIGSAQQPTQQSPANTTSPQLSYGTVPTSRNSSSELTTVPSNNTNTTLPGTVVEPTTQLQNTEIQSVVVINNTQDSNGLSGSTLTLVVFIAAILILILLIVGILVFMTRRTEFNSAVMNKSTIPDVEQPRTMSEFLNDDIADDGKQYDDIAYWNEKYNSDDELSDTYEKSDDDFFSDDKWDLK